MAGQVYGELSRRTLDELNLPEELITSEMRAPGRLFSSMGTENDLRAVEYLIKAVELMQRCNRQEDIAYVRPPLEQMVFNLIILEGCPHPVMARAKALSVRGAGLFGDLRNRALAVLRYSQYYRSIHQPAVAEQALREQLALGRVNQEVRRDLLLELASALSEQGDFAGAERIQSEILGDER